MDNVNKTLISQYANSPILVALIEAFNDAVDPQGDIDSFYDHIWNIATATGYGLDVWGRIVDISRVLRIPAGKTFGFDEASNVSADPFGQSAFFAGTPASGNYVLSDDAYRLLILAKALTNISNCSMPVYNSLLLRLFPGRGNTYVLDFGRMAMRFNFEFLLEPFEIAVLEFSNALSTPTGVRRDIMTVELPNSFGFAEAGYPSAAGFNNGAFFKGFI